MTIIIHATRWGVCRRYYDDGGELLFSAYDRVPSVNPGDSSNGAPLVGGPVRAGSSHATALGLFSAGSKKTIGAVEFDGACSTCA